LISSARTTFEKIGPGFHSKSPVLLIEDRETDHVGRQKVGCELYALDGEVERSGDRARERRLTYSGHVLDKQVALGEHRNEGILDRLGLTADNAFDRCLQLADLHRSIELYRRGLAGAGLTRDPISHH
jgi:hypothetical protein